MILFIVWNVRLNATPQEGAIKMSNRRILKHIEINRKWYVVRGRCDGKLEFLSI